MKMNKYLELSLNLDDENAAKVNAFIAAVIADDLPTYRERKLMFYGEGNTGKTTIRAHIQTFFELVHPSVSITERGDALCFGAHFRIYESLPVSEEKRKQMEEIYTMVYFNKPYIPRCNCERNMTLDSHGFYVCKPCIEKSDEEWGKTIHAAMNSGY